MLNEAEYTNEAERQRNEECLRLYGKTAAEVAKEMKERGRNNYHADMKRRDARRKR